jgi:hypothetical protein
LDAGAVTARDVVDVLLGAAAVEEVEFVLIGAVDA